MSKVILDAGHGGSDSGAVYEGRLEKDDNLRLALAVGELLAQNGFTVEYTRVTDEYDSPVEKARIANESDADYFVSFHRNSSPTPNQFSGVETLVYDANGVKLMMAENINSELEKLGFANLGVEERPNLAVLRRTEMPAVLIETGFINNEADNQLFDQSFNQIAKGISDAIADTIIEAEGGSPGDPPDGEMDTHQEWYFVQVGLYRSYANATTQAYGLQALGFPVQLVNNGPFYAVWVGPEPTLERGAALEQELQQMGYDTLLVTQ